MTTFQVVQLLRSRGHVVEYYARKDGSIRITRIDKDTFSARLSQGNALARSMTGQQLPEERTAQRRSASKYAGGGKIKAGRELTLKDVSSNFLNYYKKAQRILKKYRKTEEGKDNPFAILRAPRILRAVRIHGEEEVIESIKAQVMAIKNVARPDHVAALRARLDQYPGRFADIADTYLQEGATISAAGVDMAVRFIYDFEGGGKSEEEAADLIIQALTEAVEEAPKKEQEKRDYMKEAHKEWVKQRRAKFAIRKYKK